MKHKNHKAPINAENLYCPNCGSRTEPGAAFCWSCGVQLTDRGFEEAKGTVPAVGKKKKFALATVLILFATGASLLCWLGMSRFVKGTESEIAKRKQAELFYVKDNSLYGIKTKRKQAEPILYTDEFTTDSADNMKYLLNGYRELQLTTKDGKYHFILEDVICNISWITLGAGTKIHGDTTYTCTLSIKKGKQDPVRIDKNVETDFVVTNENKVIYKKKGNLYVYDLKDKRKIASDVSSYYVDCDGQHVMWLSKKDEIEKNDSLSDIYYQDIDQKTEKITIEQEAELLDYSDDLNSLLLEKENSVYWVDNQTEKEKVFDGRGSVYDVDMEKRCFFFSPLIEKRLSDFVEDDMLESDSAIKEPVLSEYVKGNVFGNGFNSINERYYKDLEKYKEKLGRDELRKSLAEKKIPWGDLYYYENGKSILLAENPYNAYWLSPYWNNGFRAIFGYERVKEYQRDKLRFRLSDINSVNEVYRLIEDRTSEMAEQGREFCLYYNGKEFKLDLDGICINHYSIVSDPGLHKAYVMLGDEIEPQNSSILISVSLDEDSFGEVEEIDREVGGLASYVGSHIYYIKDCYDFDHFIGDLYCNGNFIVSDAYGTGAEAVGESVFLLSDYDQEEKTGTLVKITGEETEILEEDVRYFCPFSENSVMMITDYNEKKNKGDLMYYNGKETYLIDRDVSGYLNTYVRQ